MTYYLGVDLAERYSAAVLLDDNLEVYAEVVSDFGEAFKPPRPWEHALAADMWMHEQVKPLHTKVVASGGRTGVEDVHPFAINPKPALRIQGVVVYAFYLFTDLTFPPELITVNEWQKHFGYKKQKGRSTKGWAKQVTTEMGYKPGELLSKDAAQGGKSNVDLRDAYLIARYLRETDA